VQCGIQSYVFYGIPQQSNLDTVIASMVEMGLGECDIFSPLSEPAEILEKPGDRPELPAAARPTFAHRREELAKWRKMAPLDDFTGT